MALYRRCVLCCFLAFVDIGKTYKTYLRGRFTFFNIWQTVSSRGVVPLHSHLLKQAPKHYFTHPHTALTSLPPRSTQSFGTPLHLSYKTYYKTHHKIYNNLSKNSRLNFIQIYDSLYLFFAQKHNKLYYISTTPHSFEYNLSNNQSVNIISI